MSDSNDTTAKRADGKWTARLLYAGIGLLLISMVGKEFGLSPMFAMLGITVASLFGAICLLIVVVGIIRCKGISTVSGTGWAGVIVGILAVYNASTMMGGGGAPIHDISTDTQDPPAFIAVAELRGPKDNTVDYLDDGTAALQAAAYPDIQTLQLSTDATTTYSAALAAAQAMGWEIVASEPAEGRIEATATTPFVGFKDDVVIRIRATETGSLVDVRSKSRIGKGDMGVNAKRVRAYSAKLSGS